jgi:TrmH family RNA methyltransferase
MEEIVSKDNKKIKLLRKLSSKKYRNKFGQFLVENLAIINDAVKSGYQPEALFITQELLDSRPEKVKFLLGNIASHNIFIINDEVNKSFSDLETPAGIAAIYSKKKKRKLNYKKRILYLNEIKDPGNLGTILRSAVAFDISEIILDEGCVELHNSKVIQSAKDAIFKTNVVFDKNRTVLREIKSKMKIFVTDVDDGREARKMFKNEKQNNFCVVLGSESHGASDEVKSLADENINIKSSPEMESLNVAISTGIILYEMYNN